MSEKIRSIHQNTTRISLLTGQNLRRPRAHGTISGGFWTFVAENSVGNVSRIKKFKKTFAAVFFRICGGFKPPEKKREKII
jgi:hypothetical protein